MNLKNSRLLVLAGVLFAGLVFAAGCAGGGAGTATKAIENISARDAYNLIQDNRDNPDFVVLDVRTPDEYAASHIEGAVNLDYYEGGFRDAIAALDRDKTYLVHCRSGNRSQSTIDVMAELEFTKVYHMNGGMIEWEAEGLPTVK